MRLQKQWLRAVLHAALLKLQAVLAGFVHSNRFTALLGRKGSALSTAQQNTFAPPGALLPLVLLLTHFVKRQKQKLGVKAILTYRVAAAD